MDELIMVTVADIEAHSVPESVMPERISRLN